MKRTRLIPTLLLPLLLLTACGQESSDFDPADYEHPAYVSAIEQADCCLCGDRTDHILSDYWGQDNISPSSTRAAAGRGTRSGFW